MWRNIISLYDKLLNAKWSSLTAVDAQKLFVCPCVVENHQHLTVRGNDLSLHFPSQVKIVSFSKYGSSFVYLNSVLICLT